MRFLHFIWLPEPESMSDEDKENVRLWSEANVDWNCLVWGMEELENFVTRHYPWALAVWLDVKGDWLETGETSHLAKLSDFSRYLLLHHDHATDLAVINGRRRPKTDWNFYVDVDTTPLRSLSDFLEDKVMMAYGVRNVRKLPENLPKLRVDYSTADIILSGENHCARPGSSKPQMTNCAILSRPGISVWETMVHRGMRKKHLDVLRSWGTWSLTDFLTSQLSFFKGIVMPSYYFNFCLRDMETPPPPWCVCTHRNGISWGNADAKTPWITGFSGRPAAGAL